MKSDPLLENTTWDKRRLILQSRLREIDRRLELNPANTEALFEKGRLFESLGKHMDAPGVYFSVLTNDPNHLGALLRVATLLLTQGAIQASKALWIEAIVRHPNSAIAHVGLGHVHFQNREIDEATSSYYAALRIDPASSDAHQGLALVLENTGESAKALPHWQASKARQPSPGPYRGDTEPIRILLLTSGAGGNIPIIHMLDDSVFQTTPLIVESYAAGIRLPAHDVLLNAIGDADRCPQALLVADEIAFSSSQPIMNLPDRVQKTTRVGLASSLRNILGVKTARIFEVPRSFLKSPTSIQSLGLEYPLLLRSPGYHTGEHFYLVANSDEISGVVASLPGETLLAMSHLQTREEDGYRCKYRVMIIGGKLYPAHAAFSRGWKIHYFSSETLINPQHRVREEAFLTDMANEIGAAPIAALNAISHSLNLDYAGIDFGLDDKDNVCVFEANATMLIRMPKTDDTRHDYRRAALHLIRDAFASAVQNRAAKPETRALTRFDRM